MTDPFDDIITIDHNGFTFAPDIPDTDTDTDTDAMIASMWWTFDTWGSGPAGYRRDIGQRMSDAMFADPACHDAAARAMATDPDTWNRRIG